MKIRLEAFGGKLKSDVIEIENITPYYCLPVLNPLRINQFVREQDDFEMVKKATFEYRGKEDGKTMIYEFKDIS